MGDFNAVRCENESKGSYFDKGKGVDFNNFINHSNLLDLSLGGKKFTWIGQGGVKLSKLDMFLVSRELYDIWTGLSAMVLERVFSDHCPILLKNIEQDIGPTPFRFFNHWLDIDGFHEMLRAEWCKLSVDGCARFILKEKFKQPKRLIKEWVGSNLSADVARAKVLRSKMDERDRRAENNDFSPTDKEEFLTTRHEFFHAEKLVS